MHDLAGQLAMADRLAAITQKVGFALWQLQVLEGATAKYYVLIAQAVRGMGVEAATPMLRDAEAKTFGTSIAKLIKENKVPTEIAARFQRMLSERNWLVHNSRATNRGAVYDDGACASLIQRLEAIGDEANSLLVVLNAMSRDYVKQFGITDEQVATLTEQTLRAWQAGD